MPPEERARQAAERIRELPDRLLSQPVHAFPAQVGPYSGYLIGSGGSMVFGLVAGDLDPIAGESLDSAAAAAAGRLQEALDARLRQRNPAILLRGSLRSGAATLLFIALVWLGARLRRSVLRRLEAAPERLDRIRAGGFELGTYVRKAIQWLALSVTWVFRLVIAYLWLTFVLRQFPLTEPWSYALGGWLLSTVTGLGRAAVGALPGLATATLILLAARGLARVITGFLDGIAEGRYQVDWIHPQTARATRRIVALGIWVFAIALAYPFLPGAQSIAFQGISVLLGFMLSLGSAGLLNHVMAGWVITYSRSLQPGDYVEIGEVEGTVAELGVLALKVVNRRGEEVTLPNAVVTGNVAFNISRLAPSGGMMATTTVTIGYDAPWRQIHAMLLLAAERTAGVMKDPAPRVWQRALSDFYPEYELMVEITPGQRRPVVLTALHGHIQDVFNEHGVQILSPHFVGQPDQPAVVPKSAWFPPPVKRGDAG